MEKMGGRERTLYDLVMNLICDGKISINNAVNTTHYINQFLDRYYQNEPLNEFKITLKIIKDVEQMEKK